MITRREALRTVGIISLAGAVVLVKTMKSLKIPGAENALLETQNNSLVQSDDSFQPSASELKLDQSAATATAVPNNNQSSSNCVVLCPNGCSYPGRCRRYVDSNNNQRCDLGECL